VNGVRLDTHNLGPTVARYGCWRYRCPGSTSAPHARLSSSSMLVASGRRSQMGQDRRLTLSATAQFQLGPGDPQHAAHVSKGLDGLASNAAAMCARGRGVVGCIRVRADPKPGCCPSDDPSVRQPLLLTPRACFLQDDRNVHMPRRLRLRSDPSWPAGKRLPRMPSAARPTSASMVSSTNTSNTADGSRQPQMRF
jgi:hypothetical protein